jgi:hypothetical protein
MAHTRSTAAALDRSRAALTEIGAKLAELDGKREERLLRGDSAVVIAKLDAELAGLEHARKTEIDRIKLLEIQSEREAGARRLRERASLIERFAKKLNDADAIAIELQDDVARVEQKFRQIISLREEARAAFAVHSSHAIAAAPAAEGCALVGSAVQMLLAFELYRIGARPSFGGDHSVPRQVEFPGARCPRLEWSLQPEKIMPFAEALKRASEFAVKLLRDELALPPAASEPPPAAVATNGNAAAAPLPVPAAIEAPPMPRLAEPGELAGLLARQAELANDPSPEGEAAYAAVVARISELQ